MQDKLPIENICAKMDALGLWDAIAPYNWAVKPAGTVFPYFCSVVKGDGNPVKVRFLMLEGWQTLHDYIRTRIDGNFGFYSSPMELPHIEMVLSSDGTSQLYRHDAGYMPVRAKDRERELAAKILWESYGVMLRVESDKSLPMKFSSEKALFARVELAGEKWEDRPLTIPDPPPIVERVSFSSQDIARSKDVPFVKDRVWQADFCLVPQMMTAEKRPRSVYQLSVVDSAYPAPFIQRLSINPEDGLKGLWESVPARILKLMLERGAVPGEIKLRSGRLFRLTRPLTMELPFKLSLHDSLPDIEELFRNGRDNMV